MDATKQAAESDARFWAAQCEVEQGYVSELQAATAKRRITYKELTA